ncbi:MAG TPA: zf-HC2 domain-containing protein [Vicinamibacterales bacterium]|nr:zf-HC2 domain-containing protein [Vicinamibacterales bacterium]HPW22125.1 zf-HC2 domain-containing protein [Vicinamibacterales bacterium]
MMPLSCAVVRGRLSAYQDGELPVASRVAVDAHLRACASCAAELDGLRELGALLRERAADSAACRPFSLEALGAETLNRLCAERDESVPALLSRAFQDMRLGYAAVGSAALTCVSVLLVIVIFHFAPLSARADSLAGMMDTLGAPAIGLDSRVVSPPSGWSLISEDLVSEEDAVFALAAVVTRNGRIASLEYLSDRSTNSERERAIRLLDELSRARFEPARLGGTPVTVKTVLVLARTTVRGKMPPAAKQSRLPRGPDAVRG